MRAPIPWIMVFVLIACEAGDPDEPFGGDVLREGDASFSPEVPMGDGDVHVLPVQTITLPGGTTVAFYVWADGSVGVAGRTGLDGEFLDELQAAAGQSPFELFWAVSEPGKPVPRTILAVHEHLEATDDLWPWEDVVATLEQGWLRPHAGSSSVPPCTNLAFKATNCLPADGYDHDECFTDVHTALSWTTDAVRRYRAAFCLDQGTVDDSLYFRHVNASTCMSSLGLSYVWGAPLGETWNAITYLNWTWWAGNASPARMWTHRASGVQAADSYDWSILQRTPMNGCF